MPKPLYRELHDRIRRELLAALVPGQPCPVCRKPMFPGQRLHLGHADDEAGYSIPGRYVGLVHGACNESKGGAVNPYGTRQRAAAARAGRSPDQTAAIASAKARKQRRQFRAEFDAVQAEIAAKEAGIAAEKAAGIPENGGTAIPGSSARRNAAWSSDLRADRDRDRRGACVNGSRRTARRTAPVVRAVDGDSDVHVS